MPIPKLIHPINCVIQRINRAATVYDESAREPIQSAARYADITILGQPKWFSQKDFVMMGGGPSDSSKGYVLFRKVDLDANGISLAINDRIKTQGWIVQEVYVTRLEPCAHYQDQNGATLIKAWFTDRAPAKER